MQRWVQSYSLSGPGEILVDQRDGQVRLVGWDQPLVRVEASWSGDEPIEERLEVQIQENRLRIAVKRSQGLFVLWRRESQLDLEVHLPFGTACRVDSSSGPVTLEETRGAAEVDTGSGRVVASGLSFLRVDTGSGSVQVRQIDGPVTVETGSGRIDLETVGGPVILDAGSGSIAAQRIGNGLKASTGSGSITVGDVEGVIDLEAGSGSIVVNRAVAPQMSVETGSGAVRLQAVDVQSLEAETGSGRLEVDLCSVHPHGSYQLESGAGQVGVGVPADAGLRLRLKPGRRVDYGGLPIQILSQDEDEVVAQLGAGGPVLSVVTRSGSIRVGPRSV